MPGRGTDSEEEDEEGKESAMISSREEEELRYAVRGFLKSTEKGKVCGQYLVTSQPTGPMEFSFRCKTCRFLIRGRASPTATPPKALMLQYDRSRAVMLSLYFKASKSFLADLAPTSQLLRSRCVRFLLLSSHRARESLITGSGLNVPRSLDPHSMF